MGTAPFTARQKRIRQWPVALSRVISPHAQHSGYYVLRHCRGAPSRNNTHSVRFSASPLPTDHNAHDTQGQDSLRSDIDMLQDVSQSSIDGEPSRSSSHSPGRRDSQHRTPYPVVMPAILSMYVQGDPHNYLHVLTC